MKHFGSRKLVSTLAILACTYCSSTTLAQDSPELQSAPILIAESDKTEYELGQMDSSAKTPTGPLSKEQLEQMLEKRVPGNMGVSFSQFANMLLVPMQGKSAQGKASQAISLETSSDKIAKTVLRAPYPTWYRPTLRQFLDEIAWQTKSTWKHDTNEKEINKRLKDNNAIKQLALFEFSEANRNKPFALDTAKEWTASDEGNWIKYTPPGAMPVSLDVYEMGAYSALEKAVEPELLKKVPQDLALDWARRVQPRAKQSDFTTAKVGPFDTLFFEAKVKTQNKHDVHWRQWVFMDGHQCYVIFSTLFPESESKLWPEVEAMLKSFRTNH